MVFAVLAGPDGPISGKFPLTGVIVDTNERVSLINGEEDAKKRNYIGDYTKKLTFNVDCVKLDNRITVAKEQ